jgi:cytochrome c biogenesis protein CcmG, thiol:disulfide interchange protein DsbE
VAVLELQPESPSVEAPEDLRRRVVSLVIVISIIVGLLLFVALRAGSRGHAAAQVSGTTLIGQPAPNFTATDLDGHSLSLASLRGRPLVIAFGASWCHPCYEEYPLLVRAAAKYAGRLAVVSVMYEDVKADELQFLRRQGVHWPAIDDTSNAIAEAYQVHGLPETFFVTRAGVLVERGWGLTSQRALDGPLQRLLALDRK